MRRRSFPLSIPTLAASLALGFGTGCTGLIVDSLVGPSEGPSVIAVDDDPELIRDAVPFGLKLQETILRSAPDNEALLTELCAGFTQYAVGFVFDDAEVAELDSFSRGRALRARGVNMLERALGYCHRAGEEYHDDFVARLADPDQRDELLEDMDEDEARLLYWTSATWLKLISESKADAGRISELSSVEPLMQRAEELAPCYDRGALQDLLMQYEMRGSMTGGDLDRARAHRERIDECGGSRRLGPDVAWAQTVSYREQNRAEFQTLLEGVVAADVDEAPRFRLVNIISQRKAQRLLDQIDDFFLPEDEDLEPVLDDLQDMSAVTAPSE